MLFQTVMSFWMKVGRKFFFLALYINLAKWDEEKVREKTVILRARKFGGKGTI